ncbi:Hypothetical protein FKW44_004886 [Caligus rogercresseyi]|uniref:Uncharacterized protein n=1 Tax=Caligus rogercresseyi TaxID=217165 RepID=A0A7T8KA78_CALRO|nr:Hypothetical protein FKW44_004886 [Caligus rogercresseyi]
MAMTASFHQFNADEVETDQRLRECARGNAEIPQNAGKSKAMQQAETEYEDRAPFGAVPMPRTFSTAT